MSGKCEHYKSKEFESKTIRPGRNPRKPTIRYFCNHPNSQHDGITLTGEAICGGDEDKCDVK